MRLSGEICTNVHSPESVERAAVGSEGLSFPSGSSLEWSLKPAAVETNTRTIVSLPVQRPVSPGQVVP